MTLLARPAHHQPPPGGPGSFGPTGFDAPIPPPSARKAPWSLLDIAMAGAFMALVSTLTLEWMTVSGVAGGFFKPFHFVSIAFVFLVAMRFPLMAISAPIMRRYGVIYVAWALLIVIAAVMSFAHETPWANSKDLIRQASYIFVGLVVAGYFMRCIERERMRILLVWTGLAACIILSLGLVTSLASQGGAPIGIIKESIAKSDPDIIGQQLLKSTFESNQDVEEAKVNLRHKIASALLLGLFVSLACYSRATLRSPLLKVVFWGTVVYGFAVVVFTFSRSITVALVAVLLLNGLRAVIIGRARPGHAAAIAVALVVGVATLASPVGDLLYERFFGKTESYENRVLAVELFFDDAGKTALVGADAADVVAPPHNSLLDAWLSAGLLGGLLAVIAIGAFIVVWARELRRYLLGEPGWVLPLHHFWVLALGVTPLVRVFTAANGFHLNEWTSVGVFLGCLEANRRRRIAIEATANPVDADADTGPTIPGDEPTRSGPWSRSTTIA